MIDFSGFDSLLLAFLIKDDQFFLDHFLKIKPKFFSNEVLRVIYEIDLDFYSKFRELPKSPEIFINEIKKKVMGEDLQNFVIDKFKEVCRMRLVNREYLEENLNDFLVYQNLQVCSSDLVNHLTKGDYEGALVLLSKFKEDFYLDKIQSSFGADYFKDFSRLRSSEDEDAFIPTLIPLLDLKIKGLKKGELGVIVGLPGYGKSSMLVILGRSGLLCGKNVIHYTLELTENEIGNRYDAALTGIDIKDLHSSQRKVREDLDRFRRFFRAKLIIKEFNKRVTSLEDLSIHLDLLRKSKGFVPDLILVDYADLLRTRRSYRERRFELASIYEDLRFLAKERKCPVWTVSQASKKALSKDLVGMADLSEAFLKAAIADLIIGICQTEEEELENKMRLYVGKNRRGPKNFQVLMTFNFSNMKISF